MLPLTNPQRNPAGDQLPATTAEPPGPLTARLRLAGRCRICGSAATPPATVCAVCWLIRRYPERVTPDTDGLG
jgi:hypothetical protein